MVRYALWFAVIGMGCAPPKVSTGAATTAVARVQLQSDLGDVVSRPSEVHWGVAGPLAYATTIGSYDLEAGAVGGSIFYGGADGEQVLPPVVRLAAAQAVQAEGADGALITHYLIEEVTDAGVVSWKIQLAGRLLALSDLGTVDARRADDLEALRLRYELARERLIDDD